MKIIYDEVYPEEFFSYGGKVIVGSLNFTIESFSDWRKHTSAPNWNYDFINNYGGDARIGDMHFSYDLENRWFKYKGNFPKLDTNDPYGIPNVNFTLIDKNDDRWEEYVKQRKERGFDNSELWCLDTTIAKFILPRLEAFHETYAGYPGFLTHQEWENILKCMISAFKIYLYDTDFTNDEGIIKKFCQANIITIPVSDALKKHKEYVKGMKYFAKYWTCLGD